MNQIDNAISALTHLSPHETETGDNAMTRVFDQNFNKLVSNAFLQFSETDMQYKQVINTLSHSPEFTSDPRALLQLQVYLGEYSNYVSLVSTLARKGVSTIETLEKAQ